MGGLECGRSRQGPASGLQDPTGARPLTSGLVKQASAWGSTAQPSGPAVPLGASQRPLHVSRVHKFCFSVAACRLPPARHHSSGASQGSVINEIWWTGGGRKHHLSSGGAGSPRRPWLSVSTPVGVFHQRPPLLLFTPVVAHAPPAQTNSCGYNSVPSVYLDGGERKTRT